MWFFEKELFCSVDFLDKNIYCEYKNHEQILPKNQSNYENLVENSYLKWIDNLSWESIMCKRRAVHDDRSGNPESVLFRESSRFPIKVYRHLKLTGVTILVRGERGSNRPCEK